MIKTFQIYYGILFNKIRSVLYNLGGGSVNITGKPKLNQPTILRGKGSFYMGKNVKIGMIDSPFYFSGSSYVEARELTAQVIIHDNVSINNNVTIICDKTKIEIGANTLIGFNCQIVDSDFHNINPSQRLSDNYEAQPVNIGSNVWLGNNVIILKGVTIGENSVVAAGSIITKNMPANVIIAGIPAKIIKDL